MRGDSKDTGAEAVENAGMLNPKSLFEMDLKKLIYRVQTCPDLSIPALCSTPNQSSFVTSPSSCPRMRETMFSASITAVSETALGAVIMRGNLKQSGEVVVGSEVSLSLMEGRILLKPK